MTILVKVYEDEPEPTKEPEITPSPEAMTDPEEPENTQWPEVTTNPEEPIEPVALTRSLVRKTKENIKIYVEWNDDENNKMDNIEDTDYITMGEPIEDSEKTAVKLELWVTFEQHIYE